MRIIEKDFKIEQEEKYFTLSFLKTKKEIKDDTKVNPETPVDVFKVKGYYTNLFNAIKTALIWRLNDKYPFKELDFRKDFIVYQKAITDLDKKIELLYSSLITLRNNTYHDHKQFLNRLQE